MLQMANRTLTLKSNSTSQRKNNVGLRNFQQNTNQINNNNILPNNESKTMPNTINSVPSQIGNINGNTSPAISTDLSNNQNSNNTNIAASMIPNPPASIQSNVPNNSRRKRSPGVNFTNILRATFGPIFLRQKNTNLKCKYKKQLAKNNYLFFD